MRLHPQLSSEELEVYVALLRTPNSTVIDTDTWENIECASECCLEFSYLVHNISHHSQRLIDDIIYVMWTTPHGVVNLYVKSDNILRNLRRHGLLSSVNLSGKWFHYAQGHRFQNSFFRELEIQIALGSI